MTEASPDTPCETVNSVCRVVPFSIQDGLRVLGALGLVLGSFTLAGSVVLSVYTRQYPELDVIQAPGGLLLRIVLFGTATLISGGLLLRLRRSAPYVLSNPPEQRVSRRVMCFLLLALGIAMVLLCTRVGTYPWAAPDEIHHLNLARNVAVYGNYASGHPDTGFRYFDSFDSVGVTVIGPIALAFKVAGVSMGVARSVMVSFFLLLCLASFAFCRRLYGPWAGVAAVGLLVGAFSSIYLGRTVYGEVPAFAFLLLGLVAWYRALASPGPTAWGLVAGGVVACAVLAKTIIVLVAFSFLGAWAYDRVTYRAIRWPHVVLPVIGGTLVLSAWSLFQQLHGTGEADSSGVLTIYQHYLLFGTSSTPFAISNSVVPNPITHGVWLVVALLTVPVVFRHRYSPPAVVLYFYAVFMLYWWFFFTPGMIHRYLWNAYAILALFTAPWLVGSIQGMFNTAHRPVLRLACCGAVLFLALPGVHWVGLQIVEIATKSEMETGVEVVEAIDALPPGYQVISASGRLPGLLNFFSGRSIAQGQEPLQLLEHYDVVVADDTPGLRAMVPAEISLKTAGKFVLLSKVAGPQPRSVVLDKLSY